MTIKLEETGFLRDVKDHNIKIINGTPLSEESVYGYVRRVKRKEGIKDEPTLSAKIVDLYKSGVTDKKEIMRLTGCGRGYVNRSIKLGVLNNGIS